MSIIEDYTKKSSAKLRTNKVRTINQSTPSLRYRPTASFTDWNKVKLEKIPQKQKFQIHQPLRIPIPHFFNIPPHEHPLAKSRIKQQQQSQVFTSTRPVKQLTIPVQFSKKIKQLNMMREAMKRGKELKNQARCDYSLGVLYQNLDNFEVSQKHYQRFLRIAVYFKDQKSIQLVMNTIGIIFMKMKDYKTAIQYHKKQVQISSDRNKYIGFINTAKCYQKLGQQTEAMDYLSKALYNCMQQNDKYRKDFVEQLMIAHKQKSAFITEDDAKEIQNYYSREANLKKNKKSPQKLIKSHMKLGDINMGKHQYATSGAQYAKSIQFWEMNSTPYSRFANKDTLQCIRLGYSISRAQNNMPKYLQSFKESLGLLRQQDED